jgi:hypothetical protein
MAKFFDLVIKYAGDVVNFEKDAKEAAKKMEEASLKAQFARKNMVTVKKLFFYFIFRHQKKQDSLLKLVLSKIDLVVESLVILTLKLMLLECSGISLIKFSLKKLKILENL